MLAAITSRQNPLCKLVRSLHAPKGRREHNLFLAEGKNAVEAALEAKWPIRKILCAPDEVLDWAARSGLRDVQAVTPPVLEYLSEAQTNPGVLALCALPASQSLQYNAELSSELNGLLLILDGISDPGNLGTLIRSADAAAASAVLPCPTSADAFSPKAVRASAGSVFRVPLFEGQENAPRAVLQALQEQSTPIVIADANAKCSCFDFEWPRRCALVLGHETRGVSKVFEDAASAKIKIPIYGHAESLNVASAGTVLLYAWRNEQSKSKN